MGCFPFEQVIASPKRPVLQVCRPSAGPRPLACDDLGANVWMFRVEQVDRWPLTRSLGEAAVIGRRDQTIFLSAIRVRQVEAGPWAAVC